LVKTCSKTSIAELAAEYLHLNSQAPSLDLHALCLEVIRDFPEEAAKVRKSSGDAPVLNKLIGVVIKRTRGRAEAKAAKRTLVSVIMDGDN
jgi:aspartyl-tRNA(Asn)/glutamyl-tRNA(Gln) amidotransferase subunit B